MDKVLISKSSLTAIANAIRSKNGSASVYTPSQMASAISSLSAAPAFLSGEIPDYVKSEAFAVAQKVRSVQTSKTVTAIVWADAHHAASQSSTGWQTQTNISTLHAAMGIAAIASMCPIDFAVNCGDYTFGNGDTTLALFEEQCHELNEYMDIGFGGVPALYCVGNHDTGEYYLLNNPNGSLYGAEKVYELIGGKNADGTTVMGSTTYGYCYRDLTAKKTRVICLNTVEGETTGGYTGGQCSDAQLLWFAQTLYSVGSSADWNIIVVSHYPLDYGGNYKSGNLLYEYINGGSVTYNGTTVNFAGHNLAKFAAQYHGHTHCLKAAKINRIANNVGTEFDAWRLATPSGIFYRNNDYASTPVYGINFGEDVAYTKTADSGKDTAFVVNVYDPDAEVIHSFCYGAGYDRIISIGQTVYRSISNNLTHVLNSNNALSVVNGDAYTATITVDTGYELDSLTITMGGVDITSTAYNSGTGIISIAAVTGNVVITAVASIPPAYHNLVPSAINSSGQIAPYEDGKSISSSGAAGNYTGYTLTGFIALPNGDTNHIYRIAGDGITWNAADGYNRVAWYDSNFALLSSPGGDTYAPIAASKIDSSTYFPTSIDEATTAMTFTVEKEGGGVVGTVPANATYFRIGAKGLGANLIVTLDEPIE